MQERKTSVDGKEKVVRNFEGLDTAFNLSAQGKSDKTVAIALNAIGYRTTGTHGSRPFSKDTVKDMVNNRFYVGYIHDGSGGWIRAKHNAFVELTIFEDAQQMRAQRSSRPRTIRADANVLLSVRHGPMCRLRQYTEGIQR